MIKTTIGDRPALICCTTSFYGLIAAREATSVLFVTRMAGVPIELPVQFFSNLAMTDSIKVTLKELAHLEK